MRNKKFVRYVRTLFFTIFSFLVAARTFAGGPALVPNDRNQKATGDYVVNDFVVVIISISKWILILSGSLALLAFIVGGLMLILSGGNKEMVERGKASLKGATIGLVVVLLAFTAISYFMQKIGYVGGPFGAWNSTS